MLPSAMTHTSAAGGIGMRSAAASSCISASCAPMNRALPPHAASGRSPQRTPRHVSASIRHYTNHQHQQRHLRCQALSRPMSRPGPRGISRKTVAPVCSLSLGVPALIGAAVLGGLVGCLLALAAVKVLRQQLDPMLLTRENAALREKVDVLQQLLLKTQPTGNGDLRLRFTKGINRNVILGMVDQMLANKDVNIWWLPDDLERLLYANVITLMLGVADEVMSSVSINFAGHNVKMLLTYLEAEEEAITLAKARELVMSPYVPAAGSAKGSEAPQALFSDIFGRIKSPFQ